MKWHPLQLTNRTFTIIKQILEIQKISRKIKIIQFKFERSN